METGIPVWAGPVRGTRVAGYHAQCGASHGHPYRARPNYLQELPAGQGRPPALRRQAHPPLAALGSLILFVHLVTRPHWRVCPTLLTSSGGDSLLSAWPDRWWPLREALRTLSATTPAATR